jgi:PAS domain S-box-containing protein
MLLKINSGPLRLWGYIISFLLIVVATFLKVRFFDLIGHQTPFLLYFGIIIISVHFFGKGPAWMTSFLAVLATMYFFLPPFNSLQLTRSGLLQVALFLLEAIVVIRLSNALTVVRQEKDALSGRFKVILEKSSDAIVINDRTGKRLYCSPSVKNIMGYTALEFAKIPIWQLAHPAGLEEVKVRYQELLTQPGHSITLVHRMKHKEGHWVWVESRVTNLLHDPQIEGLIVSFNDVTDRMEWEQSRTDFIGVISHELRTPLTSIKGYSQLLTSNLKSLNPEESLFYSCKLVQNVNRIIKMFDNMAAVATIDTGRMQLNNSIFNINDLIREVADDLQRTTTIHEIKAELCPSRGISGDKERLGQVLFNLISNAIKYSPSGGEIYISSKTEDDAVIISIHDHGIGIPEGEKQKVFDRLYRVDNAKEIKGLGLGLYISNQIIQLHGGSIWVQSEKEKGSTFHFNLPCPPLFD